MKTTSLLFLSLLTGFTLPVNSVPLPVSNASFESPPLAAATYTYSLTGGWVEQSGTGTSAFVERIAGFASQGVNHLGMEPGPASRLVYQDTANVFEPNTVYTLTVAVGNRPGQTVAGNQSGYELTAGIAGLSAYGSVDASTAAAAGQFVDAPPVSLNTAQLPDLAGKGIEINLYAWGNGRSHFDNIRLETTSILVTNNNGSGLGSLRRALNDAVNGTTILFDPEVFKGRDADAIVLASELSLNNKTVIIDATNIGGGVTVSGNNAVRCFNKTGSGTLTLRGLTVTKAAGVDGAGLNVDGNGLLRVENCTLTGNTATGSGGGVRCGAGSQAVVVNCTISGNTAAFGGGVFNNGTGTLTVRHCTITENSGSTCCGGLVARGTVTVENSIFAGNSGTAGRDINLETANFTRAGHNFIGDNTSIDALFPAGNPNANGDRAGTAAALLDPQLSAPADNGGPGLTRLPLPGSPVISNGVASTNTPVTDQRGATRAQGTAPDMGAVEVEWGGNVAAAGPRLTGLWLFDNSANVMQAAAGTNLTVAGTVPAWSTNQADDGGTLLNGVITTVSGTANRLVAAHGIPPSGGTYANRYTILMDVLSPAASRSSWRSLLQTNTSNANDADYYIANDDTVGTASITGIGYGPAINETRWTRMVVTVDTGNAIRTYVNGALHYTHSAGTVDGRMSLDPQVLFFADGGGLNAPLYVGAIAIWNGTLSPADIAALGGPGGPIPPDGQITTPVDEVTALPFADSPNGEDVSKALDGDTGTKYLNFRKLNTGLEIVPAVGVTRLTGLRLTSANDESNRDPATFTVLGRTGGRPWLPLAASFVPGFTGRLATQEFRFTSAPPACERYRVIFPSVVNAGNANSMQIAGVDLLGVPLDRTLRVAKLADRSVSGGNHQFTIVWAADPYAAYGLQFSSNLLPPWTLFATGMQSDHTAGYQAFASPVGATRQFFRLIRER